MTATNFGFALICTIILISALFVVRSRNLIHAVLWLGLTLIGTAALYAQLDAPFLAGVQILTYVGGVVTLMIFGVMVTRRHDSLVAEATNEGSDRAFIFASALFALLAMATWKTPLPTEEHAGPSNAELGRALMGSALVPFELLSLLLLAAIVGAVVLARKKDPAPVRATDEAPSPREVTP